MGKSRKSDDLSDEDFELLLDNGVEIPRSKSIRHRLRRVPSTSSEGSVDKRPRGRTLADDDDFDQEMAASSDDSDDYGSDYLCGEARRRSLSTAQEKLHSELFGHEEDIDEYQGERELFSRFAPDTEAEPLASGAPVRRRARTSLTDASQTEGVLDLVTGERHFRTLDERKRDKEDIPAFLQDHFTKRHRCSDTAELQEESQWIYDHFFKGDHASSNFTESQVVEKILQFLSYVHLEMYDVPYIACYFRVRLEPELIGQEPDEFQDEGGDWQVLWELMEFDILWGQLWTWRQVAVSQLEAEPGEIWSLTEIDEIANAALELASTAGTKILEQHIEHWTNVKRGIPKKKYFEEPCRRLRTGFRSFLTSFCLSAKEFGENLKAEWHNNSVKDPDRSPEEALDEWLNGLPNVDPAPNAWTQQQRRTEWSDFGGGLLQREMSFEPAVVCHVLQRMRKEAVLSCEATEKGQNEADRLGSYREKIFHTQGRPLTTLYGTYDYLLLQNARDKDWCKLVLFLPSDVYENMRMEFENYYISEADVPSKDEWNAIRKQILRGSLDMLIDRCWVAIDEELNREANRSLKRRVTSSVSEILYDGKCKFPGLRDRPRALTVSVIRPEDEKELTPALVYQPGRRPTHSILPNYGAVAICFSFVDGYGNPIIPPERFRADFLRTSRGPEGTPWSDEIDNFLGHTLPTHKPDIVLLGVGSGGKFALRLVQYLKVYLTKKARTIHAKSLFSNVDVADPEAVARSIDERLVLIDDTAACVWADTQQSQVTLPSLNLSQRRAVALGRLAQEPLGIYAGIAACKDAVMKIVCHSDQRLLDDDLRRLSFKRAMVRCIALTGFDINLSQKSQWRRPMLQFVSGFDRWKASLFYDRLGTNGFLSSRRILKSIWGKYMLGSASGFLCVTGGLSVLDATAIHPSDYLLAWQIACHLLSQPFSQESGDAAAREIIEKRTSLDSIDLNVYIENLEKLEQVPHELPLGWRLRFVFSQWQFPFHDPRRRLPVPTGRKLFDITTRHALYGLKVDHEVSMTNAKYVSPESPIWGLVQGVDAVIPRHHYRKLERYGLPSHVHCRIVNFNFDGWFVVLEPLREHAEPPGPELDVGPATETIAADSNGKTVVDARNALQKHSNFENIDEQTAKHRLRNQAAGYFIIHPMGNQKQDRFLISVKMAATISAPVIVIEVIQEPEDALAHQMGRYSIAQRQFAYFNAADMMQGFLDPIKKRLEEVRKHAKYVRGGRREADLFCVAERQKPGKKTSITSCFVLQPRGVDLVFLAGTKTTRVEEILVYPNGFGMRDVLHSDVEELITWWKESFARLYSGASARTHNATPLMTPRPYDADEELRNHVPQTQELTGALVAPEPGRGNSQHSKRMPRGRSPYMIQAGLDIEAIEDDADADDVMESPGSPGFETDPQRDLQRPMSPILEHQTGESSPRVDHDETYNTQEHEWIDTKPPLRSRTPGKELLKPTTKFRTSIERSLRQVPPSPAPALRHIPPSPFVGNGARTPPALRHSARKGRGTAPRNHVPPRPAQVKPRSLPEPPALQSADQSLNDRAAQNKPPALQRYFPEPQEYRDLYNRDSGSGRVYPKVHPESRLMVKRNAQRRLRDKEKDDLDAAGNQYTFNGQPASPHPWSDPASPERPSKPSSPFRKSATGVGMNGVRSAGSGRSISPRGLGQSPGRGPPSPVRRSRSLGGTTQSRGRYPSSPGLHPSSPGRYPHSPGGYTESPEKASTYGEPPLRRQQPVHQSRSLERQPSNQTGSPYGPPRSGRREDPQPPPLLNPSEKKPRQFPRGPGSPLDEPPSPWVEPFSPMPDYDAVRSPFVGEPESPPDSPEGGWNDVRGPQESALESRSGTGWASDTGGKGAPRNGNSDIGSEESKKRKRRRASAD